MDELSMEQRGIILTAIYEYQITGEVKVELDLGLKMLFKIIKISMEAVCC
jgi:hypothetical protein